MLEDEDDRQEDAEVVVYLVELEGLRENIDADSLDDVDDDDDDDDVGGEGVVEEDVLDKRAAGCTMSLVG